MSFVDARSPALPFAPAVLGSSLATATVVTAMALVATGGMGAADAPILFAADRILTPYLPRSATEPIVQTAALGALPGGLCGALRWWLYRRHRRGPANEARSRLVPNRPAPHLAACDAFPWRRPLTAWSDNG